MEVNAGADGEAGHGADGGVGACEIFGDGSGGAVGAFEFGGEFTVGGWGESEFWGDEVGDFGDHGWCILGCVLGCSGCVDWEGAVSRVDGIAA